jgi:starvation-inducible DNA-binding protein
MTRISEQRRPHVPESPLAFHTRNDMSAWVRESMVELLNARLADAIDLATHARQAQWNVKGRGFEVLQARFGRVYRSLNRYAHLMAERIVMLGGIALGTAAAVGSHSQIPSYPCDILDGIDHAEALATRLKIFGGSVRIAIDRATRQTDKGTAALLTQISQGVDRALWKVESYLYVKESRATGPDQSRAIQHSERGGVQYGRSQEL